MKFCQELKLPVFPCSSHFKASRYKPLRVGEGVRDVAFQQPLLTDSGRGVQWQASVAMLVQLWEDGLEALLELWPYTWDLSLSSCDFSSSKDGV